MHDAVRPRPGEIVDDHVLGHWIVVEDASDREGGDQSPDVLLIPLSWEHRMLVAIDADAGGEAFARDEHGRCSLTPEGLARSLARRSGDPT